MKTEQLILTQHDFDLLSNHLKLSYNLSEYNKKKLNLELKTAKILKPDQLPDDVVTENSKVCIQDIESGQTFNFVLVNPKDANMKTNKLST
ncbi:hypothetical protein NL452_26705, partial [Klebsiella pneumoniae]|nr:hypothetical protein [Klebsiella pneumoniae]